LEKHENKGQALFELNVYVVRIFVRSNCFLIPSSQSL